MGFVNTFFNFLRKSRRLKEISTSLSEPFYFENLKSLPESNKNQPIDDLIQLCLSYELNVKLVKKYNASENGLKRIYYILTLNGAGTYVKGNLVAASSLVYPIPLTFLLQHYQNGKFRVKDWDDNVSSLFISDRLLEYFKTSRASVLGYD